jgi:signal transduction histidine kinase
MPGLGLALVKSFIELHGGNVDLESEPGQGLAALPVATRMHAYSRPGTPVWVEYSKCSARFGWTNG